MKQEQSIAEFLEFARRQRDALAAQLRKETTKFQKYLDWDTTVNSIEQGMATGNSSSSAFRSSPAQEVEDACVEVMREWMNPIPIRILLDTIVERGVQISGTQPVRNLSSKLSNSPKFRSLGPQGWVLSDTDNGDVQSSENHARESRNAVR